MVTLPLIAFAGIMTNPSASTVALLGSDEVYLVPSDPLVTSLVVPSDIKAFNTN
ncbi:hypothetical protein D3C71_1370010 [compost metagenome]